MHNISVELFDAKTSWSGTTTFSAVVNSSHTVTGSELRVNNGAIELLGSVGQTIGFDNRALTYPNRAVVSFQLESNTASNVNLTLQLAVGNQQVTLSGLSFA